ncbi:hypothetical protein CB1_087406002 [Camelus ferus]|nr:hypothetical protein CB1_087406002 [Camelus ferus]
MHLEPKQDKAEHRLGGLASELPASSSGSERLNFRCEGNAVKPRTPPPVKQENYTRQMKEVSGVVKANTKLSFKQNLNGGGRDEQRRESKHSFRAKRSHSPLAGQLHGLQRLGKAEKSAGNAYIGRAGSLHRTIEEQEKKVIKKKKKKKKKVIEGQQLRRKKCQGMRERGRLWEGIRMEKKEVA